MRSRTLERIGTVPAVILGVASAAASIVILFFTDFASLPQCTPVNTPPPGYVAAALGLSVVGGGLQVLIAGPHRRLMGVALGLLVAAACIGMLVLWYATAPQEACLF